MNSVTRCFLWVTRRYAVLRMKPGKDLRGCFRRAEAAAVPPAKDSGEAWRDPPPGIRLFCQRGAKTRNSRTCAPITECSPCTRSVRHRGSIFRLRAGQLSASSLFRLIRISTMQKIKPRATMGPATSTVCRTKVPLRSLGLTYTGLLRAKFDSLICCAL